MTISAAPPTLAESFDRVQLLYEEGRCLDAWELGSRLGPLHDWPGVEGRLLAGRLARHLGAPRLAALLHTRCVRAHPEHPDAQYYYIFRVADRRGALAGWDERRRFGEPDAGNDFATAEYHGQCALLLAALRDFERAEGHLARAFRPHGARPYWYAERSSIFSLEDRHEDALAAARDGLAIDRRYPPCVLSTVDALQRLGRHEEALELLQTSYGDAQSSLIAASLIRLLVRFQRLDEVSAALARYEALTPLREAEQRHWILSTRAEIATRAGDYASAIALIEQIDHPYFESIAANLGAFLRDAARREPRRVELPVPFVQQHHMTCAPATLSAISRFWNRSAEHLAVAEEICYDGTPHHSERRWAETNGWRTAEFRVDWPSATALLDRGVPFTLTTSDVASGHLQAAIGYDEPTGVLLVRDPMVHDVNEMNAQALLRHQASSGPRGMAMVPREQANLLDGLELPDAAMYDLLHELQLALSRHDRPLAASVQARMSALDASHRLTLTARRVLAAYDANSHDGLAAIEALLEQYPDDQPLQLARASAMREVAGRAERLAWLRGASTRSGTDALIWVEYATELMADARFLPEAHWQLRRAHRRRPDDPWIVHQLAAVTWQLGRQVEAAELYRLAACLAPTRDDLALDYLAACRWMGETETALAFLQRRWETLGGRDAGPAMTMFSALERLDRGEEAFALLDAAVRRRPDDGVLRLFAAARCARYGRTAAASEHLAAARGRVKHSAWLAEAARRARLDGDREEAVRAWREILELEPLNLEAHGAVALLLSEMSTREEALAHLRSYIDRFPHHAGLRHLEYQWSAGDPAPERESILHALIAIDPADAWIRRELAINLLWQSRFEEALGSAREALALDASTPAGHVAMAHVLRSLGRFAEASEACREAIRRSADASDAIHGLLDLCGDTVAERQDALAFVQSELESQPLLGEGVLAFRQAARGVLTPEELLAVCRRLHAHRPESWHTWSALTSHLAEMGATDEALAVALGAAERFSMVPRLWYDVAMVRRARLELDEEITALERCRESSPEWILPTLALADALDRANRPAEAERLLESAVARTPLAPDLRVRLAEALHRRGEVERAIQTIRDTLRLSPEFDDAWHRLGEWSHAQGSHEGALEFARRFAASRPREAHAWLRLADLELQAGRPDAALEALERVIAANRRHIGARDLQAMTLVELRRFDAALAACDPPELRERAPVPLQGRAAWVEWQRGDRTGAIARMRRVVERSPDYLWGWSQLVEWYVEREQLDEAEKAARQWEWLDPTNIVPLGWLGDLRRRLGDAAGAKVVFERAMRLSPGYLYAGVQHFRIQTEAREFDGAARTLEIIRAYARTDQWLAARAELEAARGDVDGLLETVRTLCSSPDADASSLMAAVDAGARSEWLPRLEQTLVRGVAGERWHEATPTLWARLLVRQKRLPTTSEYRWLAGLGRPGCLAVSELLSALGERARQDAGSWPAQARNAWHLVLIRHFGKAWRTDPLFWGQVGFVLAARGRSAAVVRWMRGWRERDGIEPWMLQNLSLALLRRWKDREARDVLRHVATTMAPTMDLGSPLALWCAMGACLDGDLPLAERLLADTPRDAVAERDLPLRELAITFLNVLQRKRTPGSFTPRDEQVLQEAASRPHAEPAATRLIDLARHRIARHIRSPWMMLTSLAHLHAPTLIAIGVVAFLLLLRILPP